MNLKENQVHIGFIVDKEVFESFKDLKSRLPLLREVTNNEVLTEGIKAVEIKYKDLLKK